MKDPILSSSTLSEIKIVLIKIIIYSVDRDSDRYMVVYNIAKAGLIFAFENNWYCSSFDSRDIL